MSNYPLTIKERLQSASSFLELEAIRGDCDPIDFKAIFSRLTKEEQARLKKLKPVSDHSLTLWELSEDVLTLEQEIADILDDEELSDAEKQSLLVSFFDSWLKSGESFDEKALKVAAYIKSQEYVAEARRMEARRLDGLAKQAENSAERLRKYLAHAMSRTGKDKIEGVSHRLSLKSGTQAVSLQVEEDELPPEFVRVKKEPRLAQIKAYLKHSPDCKWAVLQDTPKVVQIL